MKHLVNVFDITVPCVLWQKASIFFNVNELMLIRDTVETHSYESLFLDKGKCFHAGKGSHTKAIPV